MKKLTTIAFALALLGCESSPKQKKKTTPVDVPEASARAGVKLDADRLIQTAQLLRDREFAKAPKLVAATDYKPPHLPGCASSCEAERAELVEVLFDGTTVRSPQRHAYWDNSKNAVVYDASVSDEADLRAAVVAALVEGLDRTAGAEIVPAADWDGYLARAAVNRGPGVFVATLERVRRDNDSIGAEHLAKRPEVLASFAPTSFVDAFAAREGFAFTAALHRAGGWSAVELARNQPPIGTAHVVRADRYLAGNGPATWSWPEEVDKNRTSKGYEVARQGRLGAAAFVEWLSTHIPAEVARAAFLGFESDRYRIWRKGDDWIFDWVSQWNTPSNAQQVVEALDAGLRRQTGRSWTVLRKGVTVAVIGSTQALGDDPMQLAPLLVGMSPQYSVGERIGLAFEPTPADRLQSRELVESLDAEPWTDPVTGLKVDLSPLADWNILPTREAPLPWIARKDNGSVMQLVFELPSLTGPDFGEPVWRKEVQSHFEQTMGELSDGVAIDPSEEVDGGYLIKATGKIKDRPDAGAVTTRAWQFEVGPYLATLSVQAPAEQFSSVEPAALAVVQSIEIPKAEAVQKGGGIIKFEVEE